MVGGVILSQPARGKDPPKKDRKTTKIQYNQRAHKNGIKGIARESSSGDQGDCTTESHRSPTTEVHSTMTGSQSRSSQEAKTNESSLP